MCEGSCVALVDEQDEHDLQLARAAQQLAERGALGDRTGRRLAVDDHDQLRRGELERRGACAASASASRRR